MSVLYVVKKQNQFKALAELYLLQVSCEHVMSKSGIFLIFFFFHIHLSHIILEIINYWTDALIFFQVVYFRDQGVERGLKN